MTLRDDGGGSSSTTTTPTRKKRRVLEPQPSIQTSQQPATPHVSSTVSPTPTSEFTTTTQSTGAILTPSTTAQDPATLSTREELESGDEDVGFLGSTAFNAVFTENQEHILSFSRAAGDNTRSRGAQLHEQITASRNGMQNRCTSMDARLVLEVLKDFAHLEKIVVRWPRPDMWCSIVGPWVKDCQGSIKRDLFDKYDLASADVNGEALQEAIDMLHANTDAPLKMPKDVRYRDFIGYYTGANLCWEAIGVFLTACGFSLFVLDCGEEVLDFNGHLETDKQRLLLRLLEASHACVSFCDDSPHPTDLSFWLMIENATYASQALGDAHYAVWRKLGDLSNAIFARGLHAIQENPDESFWLREMRRRGVALAYDLDKTLSTFVGRPPRISKRYCNVPMPLDLEADELALEGDALAEACSKLDSAGWNTEKRTSRDRFAACQRLWVRAALLREDVLELCLGPPQDQLREKAQRLIDQCTALYESTPAWLKHSPETPVWLTAGGSERSFQALREYLNSTYNVFMLQRMLVRRLEDSPTKLVELSHQILAAVIEARNMRGALLPTGACLSWIIVLHGLPAAAVLALELLQLNARPAAVSHARIKQDLCVFISYLNAVHVPGEGNYIVADQGRKTLQHIMDKVLATEPPRVLELQGQQQQRAEAVGGGSGSGSGGGGGQDTATAGLIDDLGVYDFSWLDAAHFDQDFWDSLNSMELATLN